MCKRESLLVWTKVLSMCCCCKSAVTSLLYGCSEDYIALDRDPTASVKSIASSVGSRMSLEGKHKEPTLQGMRLSVTPGQLVGICGQVQSTPGC